MSEIPEIKLLRGFGDLPFGSVKEQAVELFGEPEEIQDLHDDTLNSDSLVYHYWDKGFSLFFDKNRMMSFWSVEIDNREALLLGHKVFTLREKELVSLLREHGFGHTDTEMHEWGEKRVSFEKAGLDCYFENNRLVSVNFGIVESENAFVFYPN